MSGDQAPANHAMTTIFGPTYASNHMCLTAFTLIGQTYVEETQHRTTVRVQVPSNSRGVDSVRSPPHTATILIVTRSKPGAWHSMTVQGFVVLKTGCLLRRASPNDCQFSPSGTLETSRLPVIYTLVPKFHNDTYRIQSSPRVW